MIVSAKEIDMAEILTVGIAGGSGSGKTTLTKRLKERFGDLVTVIKHDDYYLAHDELDAEQRASLNYDHPDAFETSLLIQQLSELKQGRQVVAPVYDFTVHNRSNETQIITPSAVMVLEGILIFSDPALCDLLDIKIFVDTDADVRLARRIIRDVKKRARTVDSVIEQYFATVKPMHERFVEPSKRNADIIIPEGGKNPVAVDMVCGRIERHLSGLE